MTTNSSSTKCVHCVRSEDVTAMLLMIQFYWDVMQCWWQDVPTILELLYPKEKAIEFLLKAGIEYNLWTSSSNISAHTGSCCWCKHYPAPYLHTRTSQYLWNCPCLCPQVEGEGITSYILSFCLNMETHPPWFMDNIHSITSQKNSDMSCWHIFGCLVMSDVPMILVTHAVKLSGPPLPAHLSATTVLATIGYGCFMKPSSTSRREMTFWSRVPPANIRCCQN